MSNLLGSSTFRVIYGEAVSRHKDFLNVTAALDFVRRLVRRHPDWSIGDDWRDEITVCEFYLIPGGNRDTRDCSEFFREAISVA